MKYCPKCHSEYVDSLNYCTRCGCPLETKEEGTAVPPIPEFSTPRTPKKKPSLWRRLLVFLAIAIALLIGGYNYLSNLTTYMGLNPNRVLAPKVGGEIKVAVETDGIFWGVEECPEWVDIDEGAKSLVVHFEKNESGHNRSGMIIVKSGKVLARMVVAQSGVATYLTTAKQYVHFDKAGGSDTLRVNTDGGDWQPHSSINWTMKKIDAQTFAISATENPGFAKDEYVYLEEDGQRAYVRVIQGGICPKCKGTGEIVCKVCQGIQRPGYKCFFCDGTGTQPCDECQGQGKID